MPSVAWLTIAPVKGLGLVARDEVALEPFGVADNRRFYLVDENGRKLNQKDCGEIVQVRPDWDPGGNRLSLAFPDGTTAAGEVEPGEPIATDFFGRAVHGHLLEGPWSDALSRWLGRSLRLAITDEPGAGVDRGRGAVTLLSTASLSALATATGEDAVDPRRFRMLIGIDGVHAYEEDEWVGRRVRVGEAVVLPRGNVGRCAVTTQNPETGVRDLDTLRSIRSYRKDGTEPIPFGVYGEVAEPGRVRLGDSVEPI